MSREQKVRAVLFYLSLAIFFIGLPFILSFALGYKFNSKTFKFTKAGLIAIKTQPQGASIYLDGKLLGDKTPATINELLPAKYKLRIELEDYYAWFGDVEVEAGKVTRLERIILFPLRPNVSQLNKDKISSFWVDEDKGKVYYVDEVENIVYKSDLSGDNFEEIGAIPSGFTVKQWKISPDRKKLLCFNFHQVTVVNLESQSYLTDSGSVQLSDYSNRKIIDAFWHSDSYHLILITDRNIEVMEADSNTSAVNLVNLNKKNITAFYNVDSDTLYFLDSQKAEDGRFYDNAYKLDLGKKFFSFNEPRRPKLNEQR